MVVPVPVPAESVDPAFLLDGILDSFPEGSIFVFDPDLRYLAVGGDSLPVMDVTPEGLVGRTVAEVFAPELAAAMEPSYRSALSGVPAVVDRVWGDRTFEARLAPIVRDGEIVAGFGYTVDVTELRRMQRELRDSEREFRLSFDHAPIGMALVSLDGRFTQVNDALCRITGYTADWLEDQTFAAITHPDDLDADNAHVADLLADRRSHYTMDKRYRTAAGEWIWIKLSASLVRREDGTPLHFISQIEDINDRVVAAEEAARLQARLTSAHAFQDAILAASPDIVSVTDIETNTNVWSNAAVAGALGYSPDELRAMGTSLFETVLTPEDLELFRRAVDDTRHVPDGELVEVRFRARHADGSDRWMHRRMTPFKRNGNGRVQQIMSITADITEQVVLEQRLAHTALHDGLTGLPNRSLVSDRLKQALAAVSRAGAVAVLFCDLDGFKRINDSYGHAAGDHVLTIVASRLQAAVRPGETVGRMGGDEFVVVLTDDHDVTSLAVSVAERLEQVLAEPIAYGDIEFSVTSSIGIAVAMAGDDPDTVLRDSDTAMYRAKQDGKNRHVLFHGEYHDDALDRARSEALLRRALADDLLEVHYQPVVCSVSGSVVSVEALTRVPTGDGSYVDATQLVAVAEQTGLINMLGERVLERACAQVAVWRSQPALSSLCLAVNVSAAEIARPALFDRVVAVLSRTGLPASALILELTETVLIDAAHSTLSDLQRLRDLGIGIAIDDFGTGYASLRYVAELPVSCVKVDRSFTRDMLSNPTSASLVRATIRLAEDLGLRCVVEGVESAAHRDALPRGSHIGYQGYLFARPAPAGEVFAG